MPTNMFKILEKKNQITQTYYSKQGSRKVLKILVTSQQTIQGINRENKLQTMNYLWQIQKLKFIDKTSKKETINSLTTTKIIHIHLKNDWV